MNKVIKAKYDKVAKEHAEVLKRMIAVSIKELHLQLGQESLRLENKLILLNAQFIDSYLNEFVKGFQLECVSRYYLSDELPIQVDFKKYRLRPPKNSSDFYAYKQISDTFGVQFIFLNYANQIVRTVGTYKKYMYIRLPMFGHVAFPKKYAYVIGNA